MEKGVQMAKKGDIGERAKKRYRPDWDQVCKKCGSKPVVPVSSLCGPCHFGEADKVGGGWWDDGKDDFADGGLRWYSV